MEKKKRLQKRVKRIDDRFIKKGGQTDMDIAEHEARLKRLADKGGFTPPHEGWHSQFLAKSPLNQDGGKWGQRSPGTGWSQKEKLEDPAGHSKAVSEGFKEGLPLVLGAIPVPAVGGAIKGAQVLGVGSKSGKVMKGIVNKYGAKAKTFLEKDLNLGGARAKTFLEKDLKLTKNAFGNTAKQYLGKSKGKPKPKLKSTDPYANFTSTEIKRTQGMNTPLKPNLTPKNPRGHETVTLKGGRKVVKPGTPGRGGKPTYNEKNPLWPTFEGTNIDKILYPRNWKK